MTDLTSREPARPSLRVLVGPTECTNRILAAAFKVHSLLGPGLLESTYRACLAQELRMRGLEVRLEVPIPVTYEGSTTEVAYRLDMLIDEQVVVEVKSVATLLPVHRAQLLSYLRLSERSLGLLLNFNEVRLRDGIRRVAT